MHIPGNCRTTAMGIMPHDNVKSALDLALTMDIPFWPQLPHYSFYEDMYVQVSENFPGIMVDSHNKRITLNTASFYEELGEYALNSENEDIYKLSPKYSAAFDAFMKRDLSGYQMIRGQSIGPISFGLKIADENLKPIIYQDDLREFLYEFIAQKTNVQYEQLLKKHPNPFIWVDEPGLEILFGSFTGYPSNLAKQDFIAFLDRLKGPKGVHLCGNPDWSFLLNGLSLNILSMDAYGCGEIFTRYTQEVKDFLDAGNIISWGIVPTLTEELNNESVEDLAKRLEELWSNLTSKGLTLKKILKQAWLAPARCCLINADGYATVEKSFHTLTAVSKLLRDKYDLSD